MNAHLRSLAFSSGLACLAALGALGLTACGDDKKTQNAEADGGAEQGPQKPVLDRRMAAAVKAAESAQASSGSKAGADGPPETGVFGPGLADKAQPPGAPPKVEVIAEGSAPRFQLAPAPADTQRVTASVTQRTQGGGVQIEYGLALKIDKPKDDKKADGPKSWRIVGKVTSIALPPQAPRDLSDKLGKLKGSEIRYTLGPNGGIADLGVTLSKDADATLGEGVMKSLVDSLGAAMPALPDKPLGVGGYWMVTDRAQSFGVDVVRYRVYKVEKIDKDVASLSLDVRQYAAKDDLDIAGQKLTLTQYQGPGKGKLDWAAAALLCPHGEVSQRTGLAGTVGSGQQGGLQAEISARFASEEKKK